MTHLPLARLLQASVVAAMAVFAAGCTAPRPVPTTVDWHDQEAVLDHYLCYTIEGGVNQHVKLKDQFPIDPKPIHVVKRLYLCNPVEKTYEERKVERKHLESHLVCYEFLEEQVQRQLTVTNQITPKGARIDTDHTRALCLPTGKTKRLHDPAPPAIPTDVDHFKCYAPKIKTPDQPPRHRPVHLHDQFVDTDFTMVRENPDVCNPVDKTLLDKEGKEKKDPVQRKHPDAHLVCYLLDAKPHAQHVRIHNQFEDTLVTTKDATRLCVPSTKTDNTPKSAS